MAKTRELFWYDVHGTLTVRLPMGLRAQLSGSKYHGWELDITKSKLVKPIWKKRVRHRAAIQEGR